MSADAFYEASLPIIGQKPQNSINLENFVLILVSPDICSMIWNELCTKNLHPYAARPTYYLLCALLFLKLYESEEVHSSMTKLDTIAKRLGFGAAITSAW